MIIGITGTDGAGKGAVVDYLVKQKGFVHYSSRALITDEIQSRGLPVNREQMRLVANDMRNKCGLDVIVTTALEKIKKDNVHNAVIESIRAVKELETLHAKGGVLLAVDADQKLRYQRISRRQSASDEVSFAEFITHEKLEMNDPDPNGMQKAKVIELADYTIMNNGTLVELYEQVKLFLKKIHD
jgi:dephospho-CoA kinase